MINDQTGCPAQANAMPPQVAETMTTTKSDINLQKSNKNRHQQISYKNIYKKILHVETKTRTIVLLSGKEKHTLGLIVGQGTQTWDWT